MTKMPVVGEPTLDAGHEIVKIADVVERVGGDDHRSRTSLVDQRLGRHGRKIADVDVDAARPGDFGEIGGWIDADGLAAELVAGRQQQAVVAADVHDQAGIGLALEDLCETGEVTMHLGGAGRNVEVVLEEAFRHLVGDLDQPAFQANLRVKRKNQRLR